MKFSDIQRYEIYDKFSKYNNLDKIFNNKLYIFLNNLKYKHQF